jgi:DnaJ-domain-containing protein 1
MFKFMDNETTAVLEKIAEAMQVMGGRLLLQQAEIRALEDIVLGAQKKRGADVDALRKALRELQKSYAAQHLFQIGDKDPQTAQAMDIQGLLSSLISQIESGEAS